MSRRAEEGGLRGETCVEIEEGLLVMMGDESDIESEDTLDGSEGPLCHFMGTCWVSYMGSATWMETMVEVTTPPNHGEEGEAVGEGRIGVESPASSDAPFFNF